MAIVTCWGRNSQVSPAPPPKECNHRQVNHVPMEDCTFKDIWKAEVVFHEKKNVIKLCVEVGSGKSWRREDEYDQNSLYEIVKSLKKF